MSAIARENYAFLQTHPACPKEHLQLDEDGRLKVIDAVAMAAIQPAAAAACFRARVWGHLIPEIRELKGKGLSPEADSLLAEIKELRKENPFSNPRFKELLDELQTILEEISPPKKGIGKKWLLPAAAFALLAGLYWNRGVLAELDEKTLLLAIQSGQVASLAFAMLSQRMSLQAEGKVEKTFWRIGAGAGFAGCLAPFVKDDPIINYFFGSINSSLNHFGCCISDFLVSYLPNR